MFLLTIFAFLAGISTVLSPCILPVLPVLFGASANKGIRPLGICIGFILSFTLFTLAIAYVVHSFGVPAEYLRYAAIVIIAFFGLTMLIPSWSDRFSAAAAPIADAGARLQSQASAKPGLLSGLLLGIALGLIWTPCAGPILAAVITLIAIKAVTWQSVWLLFVYTVGAALPMVFLIYGGQKILATSNMLKRHSEAIKRAFGVVMILTAFALASNADVAFQSWVGQYVSLVNVEDNALVRNSLDKIRSTSGSLGKTFTQEASSAAEAGKTLPKIAGVPELAGITAWINSPPLTMSSLRGKVVLIDFWTYSCINCLRTLPYLTKWYDEYKDKGFTIIGVHTPEFEFEKKESNVAASAKRLKITYPVALDNDYKTWQAFSNRYWPAHYLVDQDGIVRQVHFGEGGYMETENAIRQLLGMQPVAGQEPAASQRTITPETYLGYKRAGAYVSSITPAKSKDYTYTKPLPENGVGLTGSWSVGDESATAEANGAQLDLNFEATRVYLVLGGKSDAPIRIMLDGKPLPKKYYTQDMNDKEEIIVKEPRKYDVLNLQGDYGRHTLTLIFPKGISAYAFTFGDEP